MILVRWRRAVRFWQYGWLCGTLEALAKKLEEDNFVGAESLYAASRTIEHWLEEQYT